VSAVDAGVVPRATERETIVGLDLTFMIPALAYMEGKMPWRLHTGWRSQRQSEHDMLGRFQSFE
jgi:hypothetical protein